MQSLAEIAGAASARNTVKQDGTAPSRRAVLLVVLLWTGCAVPLLTLGYGSDVDAWLVAQRAGQMWENGTYLRSRTTGFPLFELAAAPLVLGGGWIASNMLAFAAGLVLILLLVRLGSQGELRHRSITIVSIAFLPVVIKNATSTIDYLPALALLTGSYAALQRRRPLLCAALVGIACGVRPTSALFVAPAAISVWAIERGFRVPARMAVVTIVTGAIAFSPSLLAGPIEVVSTVAWIPGMYNSLRLLGAAQTVMLGALTAALLWRVRHDVFGTADRRQFAAFHGTNIAVWLAAFAWLPDEPEYLLPAVLSVFLVLDRFASRPQMLTAAAIALSYHLVSIDLVGSRGGLRQPGVAAGWGYTVRDVQDRRFKLWLREAATSWRGTEPTLFMDQALPPSVGNPAWQYVPELDAFQRVGGRLMVSQTITDVPSLERFKARGFRIVTWPGREWEYLLPAHAGARGYVEIVEPGELFGIPMRGKPLWVD